MERSRTGVINYRYRVKYEIFDEVGDRLDFGNKMFENIKKAEKFANKIKKKSDKNTQVFVDMFDLRTNQLIRRFKKKRGNINYTR